MTPLIRQLLAAAIATPVATLAWAVPAPTAMSASSPTAEIRHICPNVDTQLQEALARLAVQHEDLHVKVQMQVDGQRISQVEILGAPGEHRPQIRRALHGLSCNSAGAVGQRLSFELRLGRDLAPGAAPIGAPAAALARSEH